MNHAEKCPICEGRGKLEPSGTSSDGTLRICHGCNGRGWVEVGKAEYPPLDVGNRAGWPPCYRPFETCPTAFCPTVMPAEIMTATDKDVPYTFTESVDASGYYTSDNAEGQ